jgi:hypothetical protein
MARSLVVVGVGGLAISVVCLSLASVFSPNRGYSFPYSSQSHCDGPWGKSRPWAGRTPFAESGDIVSRDLSWNGGTRVDICISGTVYYSPGPAWRVSVTGPESGVDGLRIDDGQIYFDGASTYSDPSSLEVRITGPALESFGLRGSGTLILENLAQEALEIDLFGSGSVRGQGTVGTLTLRIFGSGNADLARVSTIDVDTTLFGSGNADVAPTGDVEVLTFGSGDVRLHSRPRHVSKKSLGSGRIIQLDPG